MKAVNKKVLSEIIADRHDLTKKESLEIIDLIFDTIAESLAQGSKADISGFGKFEVRSRKGRTGINPQTKEIIEIEPVNVPAFRASKTLKDAVR